MKIRGKIDTFQAGYFLAIDLHIELVGYFIGCQYAVSTETFSFFFMVIACYDSFSACKVSKVLGIKNSNNHLFYEVASGSDEQPVLSDE